MKKLLYIAALAMVLFACTQSHHDRAKQLIEADMQKTFGGSVQYEAMSTTVDSAFAPFDDPAVLEKVAQVISMSNAVDSLTQVAARAQEALDNGDDDAQAQIDAALAQIDEIKKNGSEVLSSVIDIMFEGRKFAGFKATHSFSMKQGGAASNKREVLIVDSTLTRVLYRCDENRYKQLQDTLASLNAQLEANDQE